MNRFVASVGVTAVAAFANVASAAKTITVDPSAEETETTVKTIEAAFDKLAADGDTILVRPGTYYLTQVLTNAVKNLVFRSATAETGEIDRENTIIDGSLSGKKAFYTQNKVSPKIDGFTFRNFTYTGSGVVYLNGAGAYTVQNCIFSDNEATNGNGGAIYSYLNNRGVISNCVFVGNHIVNTTDGSSYGGGAVYTQQNSEGSGDYCTIVDCAFTNNYATGVAAQQGGTVNAQRGVRLLNCSFVGGWVCSSKHLSSGGCVNAGGGSIISNCTFSVANVSDFVKNTVNGIILSLGRGGTTTPEVAEKCSHTVIGCTFGPAENLGSYPNGIVYESSEVSKELIADCTFTGIRSGTTLFALNAVVSGTMRNCLMAGNTSTTLLGAGSAGSTWTYENCTFIHASEGAVMTGARVKTFVNCLSNCKPPEGATVTTSLFAGSSVGCGFVRAGSDYRLAPDSPAVDAGTALDWHADAKDIGGRPRVVNAVDIGAYERQADDPEKIYVRAVATEADKTDEWKDAYVGLQAAVDAAINGDIILVKEGVYRPSSALDIQNRSLVLKGAGVDKTVIDAQLNGRCLVAVISTAGLGSLSFDGFTFANGCAGNDTSDANYLARGGGIYVSCDQSGSRIAFSNCRVTGCRALQPLTGDTIPNNTYFRGAGVFADKYCTFTKCQFDDLIASNTYAAAVAFNPVGTSGQRDSGMFFSDCIVSNCSSVGKEGSNGAQNAGLYAFSNAPVWIENTVFTHLKGNKYCNGLYVWPGSTVTNCIFRSCQSSYTVAHAQGGKSKFYDCVFEKCSGNGIVNSNVECERCVFSENGTIWFQNAPSRARNCLFTKTSGQIFNGYTTANLSALFENCTIVGNQASISSTGSGANISVAYKNCILWGNRTAKGEKVKNVADSSGLASHSASFVNCLVEDEDYACDIADFTAEGCILGKDPKLVDRANGDYRLKTASPARDKGLKLDWMTASSVDLAGNPRVVTNGKTLAEDPSALPDIGCYENQEPNPGLMLLLR